MNEKEELVKKHMKYASSIAKKVKLMLPDYIPLEDLIGWAYLGLVDAANKYKYEYGVSFKTYSYYRIKGAIYDGLREFAWVKPSQYAKFKFQKEVNSLQEEFLLKKKGLKSTPHTEEIKEIIFKVVSVHLISLDSSFEKSGFEVKSKEDPELNFERNEVKKIVNELLKDLDEEELKLIKLYYYKNLSMDEIGKIMGYSKAWVSRKHNKILEKLKKSWIKREKK